LIPVNYPPIEKERYGMEPEKANGNAKGKGKDKDDSKEREREILEGDRIRVRRLLVLVKGLDTKAKRALFAVPLRQISYAKVMEVFLKACEDNNVSFVNCVSTLTRLPI
jgi:sister-chromatid-cohesion protein PDS5